MGNTECCKVAHEDNYVSQVVEPIQIHPIKNDTPNLPNEPKEHESTLYLT